MMKKVCNILSGIVFIILLALAILMFVPNFIGYKMCIRDRQYSVSILTVILTFVFSSVHNSFVSVLILLGFPILITIIYEDEKLTSVVTVLSLILMFISSCFLEWDPDVYKRQVIIVTHSKEFANCMDIQLQIHQGKLEKINECSQ